MSETPIAYVKVMPGHGVYLRCSDCCEDESPLGNMMLDPLDSVADIKKAREEQATLAEEDNDDRKRLKPSSNECHSCGESFD